MQADQSILSVDQDRIKLTLDPLSLIVSSGDVDFVTDKFAPKKRGNQ